MSAEKIKMLKLDPSKLRPVPSFALVAEGYEDLVGDGNVEPMAGQAFMTSILFGEGGVRFICTMSLAFNEGTVEVEPWQIRGAMGSIRKAILSIGSTDPETMQMKIRLVTALQTRVFETLSASGNTDAEILAALDHDSCDCPVCTARREQRTSGVDDEGELRDLARQTAAAGKHGGGQPDPWERREQARRPDPGRSPGTPPAALTLGSHPLGEGWSLLIRRYTPTLFGAALFDANEQRASAADRSIPRAIQRMWGEVLSGEVGMPVEVAIELGKFLLHADVDLLAELSGPKPDGERP